MQHAGSASSLPSGLHVWLAIRIVFCRMRRVSCREPVVLMEAGRFQKSQTPNSRALITTTPTKRIPNLWKQPPRSQDVFYVEGLAYTAH